MDQVAQIREKVDIVALISEFIPLKKAGRNFKANCPFHGEKTPSFVVSPERQIWHCFGCGKGGDCFTFLMEYDHLEFPEALRILSKRTGIKLIEKYDSGVYSQKEKIYNLNSRAAKFYNYILTKHPAGKKALNYLLDERKMTLSLIETFQLGYSPSGSTLAQYLMQKKGYKKRDLEEVGLIFERSGGIFDFFKNRIMFPLTDHHGNVVGFSGRVLDDKIVDGPKYINTRETIVYHKGSLFFGFDIAKAEIKKTDQAIIMEGEFDVISAFKEGITNAVAIKGTALTENQTTLLSRFAHKISLCLDKDSAGFEAIKRSLAVLEKKNLTTTVIVPDGKDPDDSIKKDPLAFKKAVKNDIGVYDFLMEKILSENNKNDMTGKKKITDELLPFFSQIENEIIKEHYLKLLSKEIDTSYESMQKQVDKVKSGKEKQEIILPQKDKRQRREVLEEYLISLIVQSDYSKVCLRKTEKILVEYNFLIPAYGKILDQLLQYFKTNEKFYAEKFTVILPQELIKSFDACFLFPLPKFQNADKYFEECEKVAEDLKVMNIKEEIKKLVEKIEKKESEGKDKEAKELKNELSVLFSFLPKYAK